MNEYVQAMKERQQARKKRSNVKLPGVGSIVLIKDVKDKALLNIGRIESEIKRKDGVTRVFKIRLGNGYLIERPIQLVCDLEMDCEAEKIELEENVESQVNEDTLKRATRRAKSDARQMINCILEDAMEIDLSRSLSFNRGSVS